MKKNKINSKSLVKTIENNYKKIYNAFFKYSIFIVISFICIIAISKNINKNTSLDINDDFIVEKTRLIWEFNKKLNQNINNKNITTYITNGILETNSELLLSIDNLILYKDLVMPRNVFLYNISPINWKNYFSKTWYNIKELEAFARNTIFSNSDKIEKSFKNIVSLPINESLENTFYTQCIYKFKIFNKTCDYYIKNFLNNFYIYNVPNDYDWLHKIFNKLSKNKYKKDICKSMEKYILYSNDTSKELENIFLSCWGDYYKTFETLTIFLEIQDQLGKWYINSSLYKNNLLNNYKLISYQQLIYNSLQQNIINSISFDSYTNYLKSILKNSDQVDSFYLDLTYWFNNNYIINLLNKLKYKVTEIKKTEIENIIKNINIINNWDNIEWYIWLKNKLVNKNLEKINLNNTDLSIETESDIYKVLNNLKSLSFLKIINEKVSENKIRISGYFSIRIDDSNIPLYLWFVVNNTDNKAVIESININEYKDLNDTVWNIIKQKNYTITEVYQYIQDNINIFLSKDNLSTCDIISDKLEKIKWKNKDVNQIKIMECDWNIISILKEEELNKEKIKTYYKIIMDNFNIIEISISDKDLENEIKKYLNNINTNNITISNIIWEIVLHKKKEISKTQEWSNNIIMTIEDLERYLWAIPKDIVEINNIILAEFSIMNINFIWNYDIKSKKLWPLYLKYNKKNDEDEDNRLRKEDLFINNFEIYLKDENQNQINDFLVDPINYIKKISPTAIENYKKLKYK